jgi:hypothetical protein|tara:strand:+ start:230 stop:742 length:513 start_codon:yes stop_codon:yes gene_type:complete
MVTFKNLIDDFSDIATNHYLINSFHSGFLDEVDINKMNQSDFPILYCEPGTATIDMGVLTYSFTIFVLDMLKEDLTNRNIVWTSTLQTTQDIIAEFRQNLALQTSGGDSGKKFSYVPGEVVLELPISTQPFTARFANILSGWSSTMSVQVNNANNLCNAPIEPSDNNADS